jgi:hypothetical protein
LSRALTIPIQGDPSIYSCLNCKKGCAKCTSQTDCLNAGKDFSTTHRPPTVRSASLDANIALQTDLIPARLARLASFSQENEFNSKGTCKPCHPDCKHARDQVLKDCSELKDGKFWIDFGSPSIKLATVIPAAALAQVPLLSVLLASETKILTSLTS